MVGIQKHNKKSWSDYQRYATHVYDEHFLLEMFHNEKEYEQQHLCSEPCGMTTSNAIIDNWKAEVNYKSRDGNNYYLNTDFICHETGDYNIEVIYRTAVENNPFKIVWNIDDNINEEWIVGSPEYRSRTINRKHFQKGTHHLKFTANAHVYVISITFKKITEYRADDTLKRENRLTLIKASHKVTKMVGADELTVELLYDSDWQDSESLTNFLFDFRDEVNFYLINNDGEMEQVFGGYISSCTLGSNETTLTVNCAGRLIDGDNRYIVEEMNIGGTASILEENYPLEYVRNFDNYNDAIEYLFQNYELGLKSNVYDIINAKQYENIEFDCSSKEAFDRMVAENVKKELMPLGAYIRNASGVNTQKLVVYDKDWFVTREPINLRNFPIFYITYGMGEEVTTLEVSESTDESSTGGTSTGGVITTNMYPTCGCCGGTVPYKRYQKSWKNYCPNCGKSGTLLDTPKGTVDGELTCSMRLGGCDADYCGYCGGDKWGGGKCRRVKLTPASASETDNAGDTTGGASKSTINVIERVITRCAKYNYGAGISTVQLMRKKGYGDDKAFSDLIYSELVDMGVGAKLVTSVKGDVADFHSVQLKNTSGTYVDFPYTSDAFKQYFGDNLTPTSGSKTEIYSHDGFGVDPSNGIIEGEGAISSGFDKDKPFHAYIVMDYSTTPNGKHYQAYLDFTANKPDNYMTWSGLTPIFLNNIINTSSVNVVDRIRSIWHEDGSENIYLHKLWFEYIVANEEAVLYQEDEENNTDHSSCRMILCNVGFRSGTVLNPVDLGATGKTINSVMETVCESGELLLKFYPAQHREDDKVILTKDKSWNPTFTIDESKNVLGISNWSFNPVSDYHTRSLVVFKNKMEDEEKGAVYNYTESRSPSNIARYGEINQLTSLSSDISIQEAYYNARKEFSRNVGDSMTVTVYGCPPNLHYGDYVECLFENADYNDIKQILSIEHEYDIKQAPNIQTKLGLNRPNPELLLRNKFEEDRKATKEHETLFSRTAIYDDDVYTWEE